MISATMQIRHLIRRFLWSLSDEEPAEADEQWLVGRLNSAEVDLYRAMSPQDRRHAVDCGRAVEDAEDIAAIAGCSIDELIVASALHDVGKNVAGLGTIGRSMATLAKPFARSSDIAVLASARAYGNHPVLGAAMLREAGSSDLAVRWAAEHHQRVRDWTLADTVGRCLAAADGETVRP